MQIVFTGFSFAACSFVKFDCKGQPLRFAVKSHEKVKRLSARQSRVSAHREDCSA
jgi:hypothetical protein